MIKLKHNRINIIACLSVVLLAFACTPTSKLKYVQNKGDNINKNQYYNDRSEKTIQPFDYLYIKIYSLDEQTNFVFRDDRYGTYETELISYAVDAAGSINFPFIGNINVKGLTINEAKDKIEKSLGRYLNNVSVRVRFVSNKITILGEVNHPGHYSFYDEKINIFQAFGFASGITAYGNKTNITLIREKDNKIMYHYIDLTDKDIVESDFYYLLPNDILIVNPINAKYRELRTYSLSLVSAVLSTILTATNIYLYTTR
jgi:polysaccharide export outer membrane protein